MNGYPYAGKDLFDEPESYSYASCSNSDFLESWKDNRRLTLERLGAGDKPARLPQYPTISIEHPVNLAHSTLKEYLWDSLIRARTNEITPAMLSERLEPFVIKYEVFKRLYSHYDANFLRTSNSLPADLSTYLTFGLCLEYVAATLGSLKHLSCLLKICDALSSKAGTISSPREAALLIDLLKGELELIQELSADDDNAS